MQSLDLIRRITLFVVTLVLLVLLAGPVQAQTRGGAPVRSCRYIHQQRICFVVTQSTPVQQDDDGGSGITPPVLTKPSRR